MISTAVGKKPKLVITITRPVLAGAQQHVLELLTGLRQHYEIVLISGQDDDRFLYSRAEALGIRYHVCDRLIRPISPYIDYHAARDLASVLRREQPALVHAHSAKAGLVTRLVAARLGIPCVYTVHGWAFTEGAPFPQRTIALLAERFAARRSAAIVAVSESSRRLALRHRIATAHSMAVIRNGISDVSPDEVRTHNNNGTADQKPKHVKIIMIGRFAPPKDYDCLLRALPLLPAETQLILVGEGEELPCVEALAKTMGLQDRIDFLGRRVDVPRLLADSDIFVLASRREEFPISILEAMRAGLPVVAADVGGVAEAVRDGETGLLYSAGDHHGLADRLRTLVEDGPLRQRMGTQGRADYLRHFTARQMIDALLPVYNRALARKDNR